MLDLSNFSAETHRIFFGCGEGLTLLDLSNFSAEINSIFGYAQDVVLLD